MEEYIYKKVDSITFGLMSPQIIKKISHAKIVTAELYDKEGYPVDGGLMDIRLGVIDPGLRCKTCGGKLKECMGHFGYIELARPIIHVMYAKNTLDILKSVCIECGRVMLQENDIDNYLKELSELETSRGVDTKRKKVKEIISKMKDVKKCPYCGGKKPKITLEKPTSYLADSRKLSPVEIKNIFEKMINKDIELLGLNPEYANPSWMILTLLPIPPATIRPSITLESGERSEDDLTHKLGDIVRINQRLFENINAGAPEVIIEDLWELLQYHITTYFDNTVTQIPPARHRSGQVLRTLTERIKSKEGRFRHNLAGKRVNFAARTVISPDPKIKFNEVGIPEEVARELTVPERITEWNFEWLKEFVKRGPHVYPGANYIARPDGKKKKITDETKEQLLEELQLGYMIERHLLDGDIAIFNRQPSLHRMSIMCHKIKVLPGKSFRLNPSVCVAPDTKVQLSNGTQRKIIELRNCWKESELATYDKKNGITQTELKKFWAIKPEEYNTKCYKLITKETGRSVIATSDHPFYTNNSIKLTGELRVGDRVIIRPLDTPLYDEKDNVIATRKDIIKNAPKETYIKHTMNVLEELKLIPLSLKDQRSMIIARLMGHLFGDGTFILKKDNSRMIFRGKKEDLKIIQNDILNLGFKPEKIFIKTTNGEIQTIKGKILKIKGSGSGFEIRNKPLGLLFKVLGAPNGDKVKISYGVPKWIINAPAYIKREFLASYFGCELKKPNIRKKSKTNFDTLTFKISKIESNINGGLKFINDIKKMLKEFDIKITSINKESGNMRKDGYKTVSLAANIMDNKSKTNFFGKIGYIYNRGNDNMARIAYEYCTLKEKAIQERRKKYLEAMELRRHGIKFKDISKRLGISIGMLENWLYKNDQAGLSVEFPTFIEWEKLATRGLENKGMVWETLDRIEETYTPFVCDVTTTKETHNFFANGFLSGNCNPYNADFDGDEMNLHVPQYEEARAEADILMQVQTQIITPKNGLNVIGCVEDSITGNYILTKGLKLKKEDAIQLLLSISVEDIPSFNNIVEGKDVFSAVLPRDFDFVDTNINIKRGKLIDGVIDKSAIGGDNGSLIRALYAKYDPDNAIEILGRIFRLGTAILLKRGFTVKISDSDLNDDIKKEADEIIKEAEKRVNKLIEQYYKNELEILPSKTLEETLEVKILEVLNRIRKDIGSVISKGIKKSTPTMIMIKAGSGPSMLNLTQMAAGVGQQSIGGRRIEKGYINRTLSCFKKKDLGPKAHGFIKNGYKNGLDPTEFFFGAMTGRDALMDTALRTPKSGYLYRRLANSLQDLKVEYDATVRDANKIIIQFSYGDDDIDVSKSEGGKINVKKIIKNIIEK